MSFHVTQLSGFMANSAGATPAPSFRASYSDTVDRTTYTFTSCDLGTPDALRMNVIAVTSFGTASISSVTVDGVSATVVGTAIAFDNTDVSIWRAASTANATGNVVVTFTGNQSNCLIGVYALYPASQTPVDTVNATGSGTTLVLTGLAKTDGGFTIMCGHKNVASGTAVVTQTGAETVIEAVDTVIESNSLCHHSYHLNTATTTTDDYTLTWSAGGTNAGFTGATWGP